MTEQTFTIDFELYNTEDRVENEAFSALALNPSVTMCRFVLTDDQKNLNNQRIPESEFDNIIKTGVYMPIKMAVGEIKDGHEESTPIGVISHLKKVANQIIGLAALWGRERPDDVKMIKDRYQNKQPLQLSWEMFFSESTIKEDGVEDLLGTALRAITLVGLPAYAGRTPIIAVASENKPNLEDKKLEELEKLQTEIEELKASLTAKDTELSTLQAEITVLRDYKSSIEKVKEEETKLASIKSKFSEAGVEKEETYFETNKEMLLGLSSETLDFMIQEMVSFASIQANKDPKENRASRLPPMQGKVTPTTKEMVEALKSDHKK